MIIIINYYYDNNIKINIVHFIELPMNLFVRYSNGVLKKSGNLDFNVL